MVRYKRLLRSAIALVPLVSSANGAKQVEPEVALEIEAAAAAEDAALMGK